MTKEPGRPTISFTSDSWRPRYLASGFDLSVKYNDAAEASALAGGFVAALTENLAGLWQVEAQDATLRDTGTLPRHPTWNPDTFVVGLNPILESPDDEAARGRCGETLAGLLTSLGPCPDAVMLVDWTLTPTRRRLGLESAFYSSTDPTVFASRAAAYGVLRAARTNWLTPWLDGARQVRNLDAFRELHVDMSDDEALLAAFVWGQGPIRPAPASNARFTTACDGLLTRGWIASGPTAYGPSIFLSKTRRFAHRFPQVEALAY